VQSVDCIVPRLQLGRRVCNLHQRLTLTRPILSRWQSLRKLQLRRQLCQLWRRPYTHWVGRLYCYGKKDLGRTQFTKCNSRRSKTVQYQYEHKIPRALVREETMGIELGSGRYRCIAFPVERRWWFSNRKMGLLLRRWTYHTNEILFREVNTCWIEI